MAALAGKRGAILLACTPVLALQRLNGYVGSQQMKRYLLKPVPSLRRGSGTATLSPTNLGLLHGEA